MIISTTFTPKATLFAPILFTGDIAESLKQIAHIGYSGTELYVSDPHRVDTEQLAYLLSKHNLMLTSIGTGLSAAEEQLFFTSDDEPVRRAAIQRVGPSGVAQRGRGASDPLRPASFLPVVAREICADTFRKSRYTKSMKTENDTKHRRRPAALILLGTLILLLISGCATQQSGAIENPPGFFHGLLHGFLILFSFIGSLFTDYEIYAFPNTGGWYNFGFLIGASAFLGGGGSSAKRR
ncbi:MAG: hypothetical protein ACOC7X_11745, partial [Spirochaetota bacterium]